MSDSKRIILATSAILVAAPCVAQSTPTTATPLDAEAQREIAAAADPVRTPDASVGEVGQRQTRDDAAPNIDPLGRINNRIENRVQNRLRNRIDRDYDPTANANAPFERAERKARTTLRPRLR